MAERRPADWSTSAFHQAVEDLRDHLNTVVAGFIVVPILATWFSLAFRLPDDPKTGQLVRAVFLPALLAVGIYGVIVFVVAMIGAPVRQRNAAIGEIKAERAVHADPITCELKESRRGLAVPKLIVTNHRDRDDFKIMAHVEAENFRTTPRSMTWNYMSSNLVYERTLYRGEPVEVTLYDPTAFCERPAYTVVLAFVGGTRDPHNERVHVRKGSLGSFEFRLDSTDWPSQDNQWLAAAHTLRGALEAGLAELEALEPADGDGAHAVMEKVTGAMNQSGIVGGELARQWTERVKEIPVPHVQPLRPETVVRPAPPPHEQERRRKVREMQVQRYEELVEKRNAAFRERHPILVQVVRDSIDELDAAAALVQTVSR